MNHLRRERLAAGLPQRGLTALCRVSPSTISAIEKWDYQAEPATRIRIADALRVPVERIWPPEDEVSLNGQGAEDVDADPA